MQKQHFTRGLKRFGKCAVSATLALTMALGFAPGALTVKAAGANDIQIALDGNTDDWDYISKYVVDDGGFSQAAAFVTDDALYVMRDLSTVDDYGSDHLYIDADGNHTNGYCNGGIDFMVEGAGFYNYTGDAGGWGWTNSTKSFKVEKTTDNIVAEYWIPFDTLSTKDAPVNPSEIRIHIGCVKGDWTALANYPSGEITLVDVPTASEAYHESNAEVISGFGFSTNGSLKAITTETMANGVAGTFSAMGGDGVNYRYSFAPSKLYGADNNKFTINGDKLIVKNNLLAPGTYNIFVKVTSDIRSEKKAFSFEVAAADPTTVINESIFSGKNGEWFAVNHNTANSVPVLNEFKAVTDGHDLYAYVSGLTLSDQTEFFISTGNGGLDMTDTWEDGEEVDYKVNAASGEVFKYENDSWNSVGTAQVYKTNTAAEVKVSLDLLTPSMDFLLGVKDTESNVLPNIGRGMLYITKPNMSEPPHIDFDGSADDWREAGLAPIAKGEKTMGDLYAFRDSQNLYAMATIKITDKTDLSNPNCLSTNFIVNADGDSRTGEQHAFLKNSGFDFLVQDWNSVGDDRNVEFFVYTGGNGQPVTHTQIRDEKNSGVMYKKMTYGDGASYAVAEWVIPIADMENVIGNVSDDLYVAVDREDPVLNGSEAGTASDNGKFALVPKYQVGVKVSVDDGSFADWDTVSNVAVNKGADTEFNFLATRSDERLYTLVTSDERLLNTVNLYYISTDKETGYNFSTYRNIDYIVRDALLYEVVADDTIADEPVGSVWMNYYADSLEMQLYLEQIGNPDKVEIAWRGVDGTYAIPSDGLMPVTASFSLGRDAGYYYPVEDFASFGNPYKGWVGWAGEFVSHDGQPTSAEKYESGTLLFDRFAVYLGVRWSEYEPTKGHYDFEGIRKKYNLDFWKERGVRLNVRFIMDNPEDQQPGEHRMDIPQWLYDELVAENGEDGAGTFYYSPVDLGGGGFSPNYNSKLLLEYHDKVIEQLAKDFDKTDLTSFVQIGSLGHWAEMHTWPEGTGEFPDVETAEKYMESYTKYFHNVKLGLRKPYPYAATNKFGLFNDIFGSGYFNGDGTYTFLSYINDGDVDMPHATSEQVAASKMPDFWKYNYSGGEFSSGEPRLHLHNDGIVGTIQEVRDTHVSWMGPCSPCDMASDEIWALMNEANILACQKAMGYNFAIEKIQQLGNITAGQDIPINFVVNNEGVAPFYYQWPLEFSLIDAEGNVAYKKTVSGGITSWMPGRTSVDTKLFVSNGVPAGEYTLAIAIADKDSEEPAIRLAMQGGRDDLRYPLYTINLSSTGNAADDPKPETPAVNGGANAGAGAGASAAGSDSGSDTSTGYTTTAPAAIAVTPETATTAPAANAGRTGNGNATVNTPAATTEEAVANGATAGAATAEEITIGDGETALADSLGGNDETPADNGADAVNAVAVETASGFNVWVILAVVLVIAAVAGFIMYRNGIRKGGQDNE